MTEESLFHEALAKPPDERAAFLDAACVGQPEQRAAVEALLAAHAASGHPLDRPAPAPPALAAAYTPEPEQGATVTHVPQGAGTGAVIAGRYTLVEKIGEGGMGEVWVAKQTEPVKRKVALKLIKPGMDSRAVLSRFEQERQALALMDHPHIARVLDGGLTPSGQPFFVMELVNGLPLTRFCDEARLTPRDRLALFVPICQAVQHAHQKGVVHRDLKPSNILVTLIDGRPVPKVIDFGLAKATAGRLTDASMETQFGAVVGTLEYMAPEQAGYGGTDIDTRADIYALGVILYELITGLKPFDGKRLRQAALTEMVRILREEEPSKPSARLSKDQALPSLAALRQTEPKKLMALLRGELDWVVMKCLEKQRDRRYETANGLARDIERYLADEMVEARPPSAGYRLRKLVRRNKVLFITATVVVSTLLVAAVAVTWKWLEAERSRREEQTAKTHAEIAEKQAREDRDRTVKAERTARSREADALVGQAHGTRLSRRPGQRFEALAALGKAAATGRELGQPADWFDRLRNEAIAALALPDIHITAETGALPPKSTWAELSDDFELYVCTTAKGECLIRRVADDVELARLPPLGESPEARFCLGRTLAVRGMSSGRFQVWDVTAAQPALRLEERSVLSWDFRAEGRRLLLAHRDKTLSVYDFGTGTRLARLKADGNVELHCVRLHPSEPFFAVTSYFTGPMIEVRDLRTGAVAASAHPPFSNGSGRPDWSPDGRTLTVPDGDKGTIEEYHFDPQRPALRSSRTIRGQLQAGSGIAYNPAGDRFVRRGWEGVVCLFDSATGRPLFSTHSIPIASLSELLRFDRTGQRLAGARVGERNDRVGIWSVAEGREYRTLVPMRGAGSTLGSPAVHADGRLAAVGLRDGFSLFDLVSGREVAHVTLPEGACRVVFDGMGNLLSNGFGGCYRWPVGPDRGDAGRLIVGPAERLPFSEGNLRIAASSDSRVVAQCMWNGYGMAQFAGGWILNPKFPQPRRVHHGGSGTCGVSPDGRWVAFGQAATRVHVYDAATGERVWQSPADGHDYCRFSPDGRWLMTDVDRGRLYAVGTWAPGPRLGPGTPWAATSVLAVLGQTNGIYRLVELATGRELARLEDPEQNSGEAAFSPDGTKLVIAAKDGLRVWDLRRLRAGLAELGLDWNRPPLAPGNQSVNPLTVQVDMGDVFRGAKYSLILAFFPFDVEAYYQRGLTYSRLHQWGRALDDLNMVLTLKPEHAGARQQRDLIQTWRNVGIASFDEAHADAIYGVAYSPDGRLVASAGFDGLVLLWDPVTRKVVRRLQGHTNGVACVAFSPDGRRVLSGGGVTPDFTRGDDLTMRLWDVKTGKELRRFRHSGFVWSLAMSADGRQALSGSSDGIMWLWDLETGKELRRFTGHEGWVLSVKFSPDGRYAISGGMDATLRLWDLESGRQVRRFEGHSNRVESVSFFAGGRRLLSGSMDGTIRVWEVENGKELRRIQGQLGWIVTVAVSPDGHRALSGSHDMTVRLWDIESGKEIRRFEHPLGVPQSVTFSPDGQFALSGDKGGAVHLWRLPDAAKATK